MHEDNDWGISLVEDESTETVATSSPSKSDLAEGLQVRLFKTRDITLGKEDPMPKKYKKISLFNKTFYLFIL